MENKIKTTLVAAAVSAALTGTSAAASMPIQADKTLPSFDYNVSISKGKLQAKAGNVKLDKSFKVKTGNLNKGISLPSNQDHVNKMLGVNTFSWATPAQKKSTVPFSVLNRKLAINEASRQFALTLGAKHGVTSKSMAQAQLKSVHDLGRGAIVAKYQQKVNGLDVFENQLNVVMNQDMELVATTGYFSKSIAPHKALGAQFKLPANEAISKAFADMGVDSVSLSTAGEKAKFELFDAKSATFNFADQPRAKKIYYAGIKRLIPAYLIEVVASEKGAHEYQAYRYIVSAESGQILRRVSEKSNEAFTYKVYAETVPPYIPYDSPMGPGMTPHPTKVYDDEVPEIQQEMNTLTLENSGQISTNDPWLPAGATETSGNNVDAYADLVAPDGFTEPGTDENGNPTPGDKRAPISSPGAFEYQYTVDNVNVHEDTNVNAALVDMFYTTNFMHDTFYDHGFDEQAGTAQVSNYGRGGEEGDPLHAEGLDNESYNNANMLTPSDGFSPRMQMYLWTAAGPSQLNIGNLENVQFQVASGWGSQEFDISAKVVRLQDGTSSEGCNAATNADELAGNIAIVDRGSCEFGTKALNAQNAGAIAIFVANNDSANPDDTIDMGAGADGAQVTIPAAMVSYNTGQAIYTELDAGRDTAALGSSTLYRDGTIDNAIIAHEWGHYLSSRLTDRGLYNNSQGKSMGEGWSDFVALMMMQREADQQLPGNDMWQGVYNDGGFAIAHGYTPHAYYFGLRRAPYTTDMDYNALTFKHIQDQVALPTSHPISGGDFTMAGGYNAEVHASGEIWCNVLWEAYVAMLNRDGMDYHEAQSKMRDYIVAALKITPPSPTFTEARDAVLAVVIADDFDNYTVMRAAFTKRGLGSAAVSPDRNDPGWDRTANSHGHAGVVEDFDDVANSVELVDAEFDNAYVSSNGAFCDDDGILDVGETGAIRFKVRNSGVKSISGLKAKITSDADITFANDGVVEFGNMPVWNDMIEGHIEATLNSAGVNDDVQINIEFMSDDSTLTLPDNIRGTMKVNRDINKDAARRMEDFSDADTANADWSQYKIGPADSGYFVGLNDWTVISGNATGFGTDTMMGPDGRVQTDLSLMSPKVTVGASGDFAMNFTHYYEFETSALTEGGPDIYWDGAVLEVSVDGGDWTDVVDAGGTFATGYNGVINPGGDGYGANPVLGGRNGFVSVISSFWLEPDTITFPDGVMNGHEVQFRFRIGTDGSEGAWGWNLDDVSFVNATNAPWSSVGPDSGVCVNRPPTVSSDLQAVAEASGGNQSTVQLSVNVSDWDGDSAFIYNWTQVSGPSVTLNDAHSATPSFTAPVIGQDTMLKFNVEVSDGTAATTASVSVNLLNVNSAPSVGGVTGPDSVKETVEVSLQATATDPENDNLTYTWTQTAGTTATFSGEGATLTFNAPEVDADETLTFAVTASDGEYTSAPVEYSFMVKQNNAPVVTAAESTVTVKEEESVTLSVSGSDADGDDLTYTWMVDGVDVGNNSASYNYTAPKVTTDTTVNVTVTATDGLTTSAPAAITVNVDNKSSGGSFGLLTLLLAPLAFIRRRKFK